MVLFPATMGYYKHRQIATRQCLCIVVANDKNGGTVEIIEGGTLSRRPLTLLLVGRSLGLSEVKRCL